WRDGPVLAEVDAERRAPAYGRARVVVLLDELVVVRDELVAGHRLVARIGARGRLVVHPPGLVEAPSDDAQSRVLAKRDIHEAFGHVAGVVAVDHVELSQKARGEARRIRLVG